MSVDTVFPRTGSRPWSGIGGRHRPEILLRWEIWAGAMKREKVWKRPGSCGKLVQAGEQSRGSVRSMYELGRCCQGGIGVAEDLKQALIWFHKSAESGGCRLLGALGWSYEYGIGTEQDYARAVEYYRCAAEKGMPPA